MILLQMLLIANPRVYFRKIEMYPLSLVNMEGNW